MDPVQNNDNPQQCTVAWMLMGYDPRYRINRQLSHSCAHHRYQEMYRTMVLLILPNTQCLLEGVLLQRVAQTWDVYRAWLLVHIIMTGEGYCVHKHPRETKRRVFSKAAEKGRGHADH